MIFTVTIKNEDKMKSEGKSYDMLDKLIDEALGEAPGVPLSAGFTSRVLEKIEKPDILKELAFESTLKVGLVIGLLVILATSFLLFGISDLHSVETFVLKYKQVIIPVALLMLFTWLFNDIVLKYMFWRSEGL